MVETLEERRKKGGLKPGEWDAGQSLAARRARELAGRRAYLKNFWYAAGEHGYSHCLVFGSLPCPSGTA